VRHLFALLFLCLTAAALAASAEPAREGAFALRGTVTYVVDGDTISVRLDTGRSERVRLIGIDTPERGACLAGSATGLTRRLADDKRVVLRGDATQDTRDRYGRLLAYVYRERDGLFVNAELVRRGYASAYTVPPNVRHEARFRRLAARAREAGAGLWSECVR
jgi:micrococcal nuclease